MTSSSPESIAILLVEDEEPVRFALETALKEQGYAVEACANAEEALERLHTQTFDIAITDVKLPGASGLDFVSRARALSPELILVAMSGVATKNQAIEALARGAYDFFSKPFRLEELKVVIARALERRQLQREVQRLRDTLQRRYDFPSLVGQSGRMEEVFASLSKVIRTHVTVLIQGESGTGKELVAEVIHQNGPRKGGPFIKVNCAAIPEGLLESELFGHERGAFTGATTQKPGKFELAHGGTLFLDEVGDMALATQAKILRVLEAREIYRVGGTRPLKVDVRIIAATNKSLADAVQRKEFREDLYYRLNVFSIVLPPLRERAGDIPLLVEAALREIGDTAGKMVKGVSPEALERLMAYSWPGNVRELRNTIERATVLCDGDLIQAEDLPVHLQASPEPGPEDHGKAKHLDDRLAEMERTLITEALRESRGVQAQAARKLGINERSLWYRIKKFGIDPDSFKP
ncbi:MAG: sigma-54-dependent Fis family transcriptional regulator [Candidatus Rokubacteria bacterium]|nr:sigma-54-dependent Fis family transcriptional regulator [Candidatus Rokubacteria bacterium]